MTTLRSLKAEWGRMAARYLALMTLLLLPTTARGQLLTACEALGQADLRNQRVRLATQLGTTEGRIDRLGCPGQVRVGGKPVAIGEILEIDTRLVRADPLGNGIAIGALTGGLLGGLVTPLATYGEVSPLTGVLAGVIPGALAGFFVDVLRQGPAEWVRVWRSNR